MGVYAIGDIHGSYNSLKTLINVIPFQNDNVYIFLGDYIDKGNSSRKVIELLIGFSKKANCIFIRGNHEILMLTARHEIGRFNEWMFFGGDKTLKSYRIRQPKKWVSKIKPEHWTFIENTIPYFKKDNFIFVHAGLESGVELEKQKKHRLFWDKYHNPKKYNETSFVICGHTSRKNGEIANFGHTICVDTFAYAGMWLTGLNVSTGEYFQTNEKKKFRKDRITIGNN